MDKRKRLEMVQQMSTLTNQIPGSIGERRDMRQQLEAMVHQVEAETAGDRDRFDCGFAVRAVAIRRRAWPWRRTAEV